MKIGDLAKRTGLSAHTIRYYERIGLLPRAPRGPSSQRKYDASILPWIEFLGRLKTTGMPIRDIVRYAALRAEGSATEGARRELLAHHRANVRAHLAELHASCPSLTPRSPATPAPAGWKTAMTQTDTTAAQGADGRYERGLRALAKIDGQAGPERDRLAGRHRS